MEDDAAELVDQKSEKVARFLERKGKDLLY